MTQHERAHSLDVALVVDIVDYLTGTDLSSQTFTIVRKLDAGWTPGEVVAHALDLIRPSDNLLRYGLGADQILARVRDLPDPPPPRHHLDSGRTTRLPRWTIPAARADETP